MSRLGLAAALLGATAVALGAFGAHGLKAVLSADALVLWETGVRYQLAHALAALAVALAPATVGRRSWRAAGWLFCAGSLLFAGSLYALALGAPRAVGAITPLGGLAYIGGWLLLALGFWRNA